MTTELALVLFYLALQLAIGVWISRRIRTEADYLLAGRKLGYTLATFSIFATWFGAETVVGAAGGAYADGISLASPEPFGYALCLALMGLVFAVPLWKRGLTTLADLFRQRYGHGVERLAALILIPGSILWAAAQIRAFGQVISVASGGWNVDVAIGLAALFTILYTMFGGLLVDAVTDLIQGGLVLLGLIVLGALVYVRLGDAGAGPALDPATSMTLLPSGGAGVMDIAEAWAIPVIGSVLATELVGRVIATRSGDVARRAPLMAAGIYLCAGIIPVGIGLVAASLGITPADPEQVVPLVARELMPAFVYAAFIGAFISAILSTVDSTLLTASGLLSHNLIVPIARITNERTKVRVARAGVFLFGILAYTLALTADGVYALVETASALGSAGAVVCVTFGLFSNFGGARAAFATLLVGALGYTLGGLAGLAYPFLTTLAFSLVTYVAVATFEPREPARRSAGVTG